MSVVCNICFRKSGFEFEKICWKRVKDGFIGFTVKNGGLCIKVVSKIKRVGSDIVHQCKDSYVILSKIYILSSLIMLKLSKFTQAWYLHTGFASKKYGCIKFSKELCKFASCLFLKHMICKRLGMFVFVKSVVWYKEWNKNKNGGFQTPMQSAHYGVGLGYILGPVRLRQYNNCLWPFWFSAHLKVHVNSSFNTNRLRLLLQLCYKVLKRYVL